jgi:prepilin-type N-terminal cleavage/methylation domain-containing protein
MKIQVKRTFRRGFTLVELLVVVVIIAVLASIGFAVSLGALQRARMVTSLSSATNVANAVEAFYSEYNLLPAPVAGAPDEDNTPAYKTDANDGIDILEVLSRLEADNDDMQNERKINFLSLKEADKGNRDGIVFNSTGDAVTGLFDAWGQPFYMVIDYDYDGRLDFDVETTGYSYNVKLNNKHIAVYSLGADLPEDAERKHLVKTW